MKKKLIMAALLLAPMAAHAMPAVTNGGHVACVSEQWYEDMVAFVIADDDQMNRTGIPGGSKP